MSDFKHKWMRTDSKIVELKETKNEIVFTIPKSLIEHDKISLKENFILKRLDKNIFLLFKHKDEKKAKKLLKGLEVKK